MSASSFHTGLPSALAQRSQTALTTAAVARWMTPFSGPIQRSWLSPVTAPEAAEVGGDAAQLCGRDQLRQEPDGRDAQLVAAADREGYAVAFEPSGSVWRMT